MTTTPELPTHGHTTHGWPCCERAGQPATPSCAGASCAACRIEVQTMHTAMREAGVEVKPK